jgi:hypothetical protein
VKATLVRQVYEEDGTAATGGTCRTFSEGLDLESDDYSLGLNSASKRSGKSQSIGAKSITSAGGSLVRCHQRLGVCSSFIIAPHEFLDSRRIPPPIIYNTVKNAKDSRHDLTEPQEPLHVQLWAAGHKCS